MDLQKYYNIFLLIHRMEWNRLSYHLLLLANIVEKKIDDRRLSQYLKVCLLISFEFLLKVNILY